MKKSLLWIVVMVLSIPMVAAFSFVGCKTTAVAETTAAVAETTAAAPAEVAKSDFFVAYIAKNTVDVFHQTLNTAAQIALDALVANGEIGSWQLYDGLTDPVTQVNLVEDAINMGADLIILLPAEAVGSAPVVARCAEKNIPCIVINSRTDNTSELATAYVGSEDVQAGEMMAEFVQEQLPDGGGYGHIQGVIGSSAQIERGEGLHNILDSDGKWTLLDGCEQTGEWQGEKAVKFAEDWLAKYGEELNAIICDNDDMSSAVQTSMNTAGRNDIVCIGVDGNKGPMEMVQNGELLATVLQDGTAQVTTGIEFANKVLHGEEVAKETWIPFVLITKDNVGQYLK